MRVAKFVGWVTSTVNPRRQTQRHRQTRRLLHLEQLEARDVPTINPTGMEQEMLELVNRMRMDPAGELGRLLTSINPIHSADPAVQSALQYFGVSGTALASQWASLTKAQPLAWSDGLENSSRTHNQAMITADTQSHQLPGEADLGSRITSAGYANWNTLGENIYAYSNTVSYGHAGFAIDWGFGTNGLQSPAGHRINMMNNSYREVGISVIAENNAATEVGPLVITQDFGVRYNQGNSYLLGVVYSDSNSNNTYNAGEGLGGVSVTISGSAGTFNTTTMSAGGYQLQVPSGSYTVTFSGGGLNSPITKSVTVGSSNVKVDGIAGQSGNPPPPANTAPVLDASYVATLGTIAKGAANPTGVSVANIVGNSITDANANAQKGIAVYAVVNTNGQWQYSLNSGSTWTNFGAASPSAARLLRLTDLVRFVPNATYTGSAGISYRAWDQTTGTAGSTANISTTASIGGSTAFSTAVDSASVNVSYANAAPVLNTSGTFTLPYVKSNSTTPPSMQVSTLLGTNVTDANAGALKGLAITAIDNTKGYWQYTTNAGSTWSNVPASTNNSALLLRSTDYLRFYPKQGIIGISSMVFRAWDQTSGAAGTLASLGNGVGGSTAFSADQVFARVQVGNNAPVLNTSNPFTLKAFTNGSTTNPGTLVSTLLGQAVTDPDMNAKRGIAITSLAGTTTGTWQYSTNGGTTWTSFSAISSSSALLLRSQDLIRYVPKSTFHGSVSLQFRAWDQMSGIVASLVNLTATRYTMPYGGSTAYSSNWGTASLQVV